MTFSAGHRTIPAMSARKQSPAMSFILAALEKNKDVTYGELVVAAEQQDLQLYPIMFGRAQAQLRAAKSAKPQPSEAVAAQVMQVGQTEGGKSKSPEVRTVSGNGLSGTETAEKVARTVTMGNKSKPIAKPKKSRMPRKADTASVDLGLNALLAAVQDGARETARMRTALEEIQAILQSV